jgi:AraC-like DNA-binding protein
MMIGNSETSQVKAAAACGLVPFILGHGADPYRIFSEIGVQEHVIHDPDASIPLASYVALMESAAARTGNSLFGQQFGIQFPANGHGLIGEVALSAPTIGSALKAFVDFFPVHQNNTRTAIVHHGRLLRMEYRILDARIWERRQDAELTIAMFANLLAHAFGPALYIEEISFEHPGRDARTIERAFGAPVFFGARTNAITVRARGLDRAMPGANLKVFARITEQLRRSVSVPNSVDLKALVCGEIRRLLPEGYPSIEIVAESLNVARWTLQRRLAEDGVSFSDCVNLVRSRLAIIYLAEPHLSISNISDLLGYSEISAFSRACRRWHGAAPESLRKRCTNIQS